MVSVYMVTQIDKFVFPKESISIYIEKEGKLTYSIYEHIWDSWYESSRSESAGFRYPLSELQQKHTQLLPEIKKLLIKELDSIKAIYKNDLNGVDEQKEFVNDKI